MQRDEERLQGIVLAIYSLPAQSKAVLAKTTLKPILKQGSKRNLLRLWSRLSLRPRFRLQELLHIFHRLDIIARGDVFPVRVPELLVFQHSERFLHPIIRITQSLGYKAAV